MKVPERQWAVEQWTFLNSDEKTSDGQTTGNKTIDGKTSDNKPTDGMTTRRKTTDDKPT